MTHHVTVLQGTGGSLVLLFGIVLAAAGGIGGGGLNVPVLLVIFGFDFRKATRLSLCLVLGNLISQFFLNRKSCHPKDPTRPLQYWDLVLVFAPAQLIGSTLGIVFRDTFPETVAESVAGAVLLFAATKSVIKGVHTSRLENTRQSQLSLSVYGGETSIDSGALAFSSDPLLSTESGTHTKDRLDALRVSESYESRHVIQPWRSIGLLAVAWLIYTGCFSAMAFTDNCSVPYIFLLVIVFFPLGIFVAWSIRHVALEQQAHPTLKLEGDLDWGANSTSWVFAGILIGVLSSTLGIGGGELMGPLMLAMGVLPQVVAGTTPVLSFISTFSNVIQYSVRDEIPFAYAMWMASIGLTGGFVGRKVAIFATREMKRPSVTVFCLAAVLYAGLVMLVYSMVQNGINMEVGGFCNLF